MLCFVGCEQPDDTIQKDENLWELTSIIQNAHYESCYITKIETIGDCYCFYFSNGTSVTLPNDINNNNNSDKVLISSFTIGENEVVFQMSDGQKLSISLYGLISITFDTDDLIVMWPNSTHDIHYTVSSQISTIMVEVSASEDIEASVVQTNACTGTIHITTGEIINETSHIIVFVSNGERAVSRKITIEESGLQVYNNDIKTVSAYGGYVNLEYFTNIECEVVIPEESTSWISKVSQTRALKKKSVMLKVEKNEGHNRNATIVVQSLNNTLKLEYRIDQSGVLGTEIDPSSIPDNEIWYRTSNNIALTQFGNPQPFNVNIISNIYKDGLGIITCDGAITKINKLAISNYAASFITELYLPNCVENIDWAGIAGISTKSFYIPQKLKSIKGFRSDCLEKFIGYHGSTDGKSVVIDGTLWATIIEETGCLMIPSDVVEIASMLGFSPSRDNLKKVIFSNNVKKVGEYAFSGCAQLESVILNHGLESICQGAFALCVNLKNIIFPNTLIEIEDDAFMSCALESVEIPTNVVSLGCDAFYGCYCVKEFRGKFASDDNMCLIIPHPIAGNYLVAYAHACNLEEYYIPEGVNLLRSRVFVGNKSLKKIITPSTELFSSESEAVRECDNLECIEGRYASKDNRCAITDDGTLCIFAGAGIKEYTVPDNVKRIISNTFSYNNELVKLIIPDNVLQTALVHNGYFYERSAFVEYSPKLETIVLSAKLNDVGFCSFEGCPNLRTIFCRSLVPPRITIWGSISAVIYVPRESLELYKNSPDWALYKECLQPYDYTDLPYDEYYISSDYSQDGAVTMLQKATEGNGVDIVLMGDGYSDRQIADGTYERVMKLAYEKLFTEEPYKSYKELFNVYYVTAVSATEGYEHGNTAFGGWFGEGTAVGGSDDVAMNYALNAVEESRLNNTAIVVMMNSDRYAGTCYMYYPDGTNDYGSGVSVSYFPVGTDEAQLEQLLHHETCGHGFTKLADEYAYDYMGAVPADQVAATQSQRAWGWWKNVDFTSDTTQVLWAKFISDERYKYDGLGAYEGGMTYWSGVWRPTENSIMNTNVGGFNAPSREAIYYRIHKLAYGNSWTYDYEKFVEYDEINRKTVAMQATVRPMVLRPSEMPTPPVVVRKTWRDVLKR